MYVPNSPCFAEGANEASLFTTQILYHRIVVKEHDEKREKVFAAVGYFVAIAGVIAVLIFLLLLLAHKQADRAQTRLSAYHPPDDVRVGDGKEK